jgi:hypothetical protein
VTPNHLCTLTPPSQVPAWSLYAAELRQVFRAVIEKSGVGFLGFGGLLVSEPPPDRHLRAVP